MGMMPKPEELESWIALRPVQMIKHLLLVFLLLENFRQILTWKIWFRPIGFLMGKKMTQISQILNLLKFQIARVLW
jgi:hypothetical protein